MNFDEAIRAHSDWKMKLTRYLSNPDGSINVQELSKDHLCTLGKWLHGEGRSYKNVAEYQKLIQDHAHFHRAAADIVIRKDRGEDVKGDISLGGNSPFAKYSMSVVSLLMKMKTLIK